MNPSTDIQSWLEILGLGDLATVFEENQIKFDSLENLTAEDLGEMGITSLGKRKKLLAGIAALKMPASGAVTSAPLPSGSPVFAAPKPRPPATRHQRAPLKLAPPAIIPEPVQLSAPLLSRPVIAVAEPHVSEPPPVSASPKYKRKAFSAGFLTISICLHLIVAVGAGYWVVQRIEAKRKLQFASGPPTANPSKRALEHKVSLQKKRNAGGSPAQARRIVVSGLAAKITLPDMPSVPTTSTQFVAGRMAGMGGAGFGSGLGFGNGSGMGVGGTGAGGLGLTMFGARAGAGLTGVFYDLKQTKNRKPTDMAATANETAAAARNKAVVEKFVRSWNPNLLREYYSAPNALVVNQLFIPKLLADEAPKAFKVEKECEPRHWLIHYQGQIVAPRDGTFRFAGSCDDFLVVRCNKENVLDGSVLDQKVVPEVNESLNAGPAPVGPIATGKWIKMRKGETLSLEVLIGENPGGAFSCFLMMEEQGVEHPSGVFPVFQLRHAEIPKGIAPSHHGSIIFGSRATTGSPLDVLKR